MVSPLLFEFIYSTRYTNFCLLALVYTGCYRLLLFEQCSSLAIADSLTNKITLTTTTQSHDNIYSRKVLIYNLLLEVALLITNGVIATLKMLSLKTIIFITTILRTLCYEVTNVVNMHGGRLLHKS